MIKQLGCTKILYSSDNVDNMPVELVKYRALIKNQDDLDNVLYKNAVRVYNLKI